MRLAIAGAGRMGQSIQRLIDDDDEFSLAGLWRRGDDIDELLQRADAVVDFSLPDGTAIVAESAARHRKPMVSGVSGLDDSQYAVINATAACIPLVYDRNMSLGIAVLARTVAVAAASLGDSFDVRIAETHHVHKKDAPSGTALLLGAAIAAATGAADDSHIEYRSERRGDVPGDHEITLRSATEELRYRHSVMTRDVFAAGALRAVRWVTASGRPPGLYSMQDVLF